MNAVLLMNEKEYGKRPLGMYSFEEVMVIINLSRTQIFYHMDNKNLNSRKIGGRRWYSKKDLLSYLTEYSGFSLEEAETYFNNNFKNLKKKK